MGRIGHNAVVKLLLEESVELEPKDDNGQTPLSYAAQNGYEAVVRLLLDKGVDMPSVNDIQLHTFHAELQPLGAAASSVAGSGA